MTPLHFLSFNHLADDFSPLGAVSDAEELDCILDLPVGAYLLDVFLECLLYLR
jgi:hypothetical protein